ncbi:unnamed protein product [Porites lobata]|uniref:Ig-like domain-containing protein n=1 Tax=Porites lobata TaxID=104759 RepID=A0ABN8REH5_9CNID|nr:unnamed protein product [Porites lobata]
MSPEVRTVPSHYIWCTANGTPPIYLSLVRSSTQLASGVGRVHSQITQTGNYTCTARNDAGMDTRDFSVAIIDCGGSCWEDGNEMEGQFCNIYDCTENSLRAAILTCIATTTTKL